MYSLSQEDRITRFWSQVEKTRTCWIWMGYRSKSGHGIVTYRNKQIGAHRVSWIITHGDILPGLVVCHRPGCPEPACVNPAHLYLGTPLDNRTDGNRRPDGMGTRPKDYQKRQQPSFVERFWARVQKTETCWLWTGAKTRYGHGHLARNGIALMAHRVAWELVRGPIPDGLVVRHLVCDNAPCVNPDHLALGSHKDNSQDMVRKGRQNRKSGPENPLYGKLNTHCRKGHALTDDNVVWTDIGNGKGKRRRCKICAHVSNLAKDRRYKEKNRELLKQRTRDRRSPKPVERAS